MTVTADTSSGANAETAAALRAITGELADRFLERASVVRALVTAVLAGQHSLLLGPPGRPKASWHGS